MGTERRRCRSRKIGNGEGKAGVVLSIVVSSVSFFSAMLNGGGGFLQITAGSDVSLGIDSWLDLDMSSPSLWPLLVYDMDGGGMCVDSYHLLLPYITIKYKNKSFFNMLNTNEHK